MIWDSVKVFFADRSFVVPQFGLNSIIDILVIAFLIYKLLLWIQQTRAWILFKGIVVIALITALSSFFGLHTVSWLVNNAFNVGLIAVIVLFQPELRKALEKLGKGKLVNLFDTSIEQESHDNAIEEIIKACLKMAKARTGALMVIERREQLDDIEATGIKVDAIITAQLLVNIFENKTPLHDGAVLIRKGRVASATCILPLTSQALASELGTRHRAAVGASEETDAIVVVVSEETGDISVAIDGKLNRSLNKDKLADVLSNSSLADKNASKKRLTDILKGVGKK